MPLNAQNLLWCSVFFPFAFFDVPSFQTSPLLFLSLFPRDANLFGDPISAVDRNGAIETRLHGDTKVKSEKQTGKN